VLAEHGQQFPFVVVDERGERDGVESLLESRQRRSAHPLDDMAAVLLRVGALGKILRDTPALRAAAEPRLRDALAARASDGPVALNAATWIVTARA